MPHDPWLSSRMAAYARARRAENQLHPAFRSAVTDYLTEARTGLLDALTASAAFAADDDTGDPPGLPPESAWRRALDRHVLPVTRAVWRASFGRIARRTPDDDAGHGAGLGERLAGFRRAVADRVRRTLRTGRARGETPDQLRARVAALMTLEEWDGQVMTMTRTETMTALNAGAFHGALSEQERTGQPWHKRWQATHDQRVRHTHHTADGQTRPLHDPFEIGDSHLQFPGDPRGSASEVINCRCAARYAPANDPSLTASAPTEGRPMHADPDYRDVYTPEWRQQALTAAAVTVEADGAWSGVLAIANEFSADQRMLRTPEGGYRSRPLPLPMLVQTELNNGHDKAKLGLSRLDRIWVEGDNIMGEGQFDMADPLAAEIARKVSEGFMRFVSLDVDDATGHDVCVAPDGTITPNCDPRDPSFSRGTVYTDWRVMGLTLLAHPAFPNAFVSLKSTSAALTSPASQPFATTPEQEIVGYNPDWGCVKPNGDGWTPADCDAPDAQPANPTGDGPFDPETTPTEPPTEPVEDLAETDSPTPPETPADDPQDDQETACVAPDPDTEGGWVPAPCDAEGAVPANPEGTGPAEQTDATAALAAETPTDDQEQQEDGAPTHAGLAIKALDTGRVLLIQRALDDDDPAAGTWEFPGGSIEDGEDPQTAAFREFAEETGITPPDTVQVTDGWRSANGVYQGFIATIPTEGDLGINPNPDERTTLNPDDPDHDNVEVVAWWEIAALPEMSALRPEVRETPWEKLEAAGGTEPATEATPVDNAEMSTVPEDCEPCRAFTITAAAADTTAPGWTPDAAWFQPPASPQGAHPIRVDEETGRVFGYLAPWDQCHIGYKDRCVTPPRSATDYSYFNIRPVRTSNGTVHCGLLTMDTGHANINASAAAALAHYDNTGTQAAVVRVGEDQHGIWAAGAVLPFLTPEQRIKLSLSGFSGDWRQIRGAMELVAALAVNVPGFPMAASRTGTDNQPYALVAGGFFPPDEEPAPPAAPAPPRTAHATITVDEGKLATLVVEELERRQATAARTEAARQRLTAFRQHALDKQAAAARHRIELARGRVTRAQKPRADEPPLEMAGFGDLPIPSTHDIALAKNWVDQQGGLPKYIKRIAKHLQDKGMDKGRAIATAVNAARKMCKTGDLNWPGVQQVNAGSKAEACAAIARWEEMKAAAKAS